MHVGGILLQAPLGQSLALETRRKTAVDNYSSFAVATAGMRDLVTAQRLKYPQALHRRTEPSDRYNCHGLTFASRRTGIQSSAEVEKILIEDDYQPVPLAEIQVGDIAVYRTAQEITHTGILVGMDGQIPLILSKWGMLHEVVHRVTDCTYPGNVSFYRIYR